MRVYGKTLLQSEVSTNIVSCLQQYHSVTCFVPHSA